MNFLGHWLFSEATPDALVGSLWPDFGLRPAPEQVSETFLVHFDRHQWLDRETDHSPLLEPLRRELRPKLSKTTPLVVDMLIDHHLARHWSRYHDEPLSAFSQARYQTAHQFHAMPKPNRLERTLLAMQAHDWLVNYQYATGVRRAFEGLTRRLKFDNPMLRHCDWALAVSGQQEDRIHSYLEQVLAITTNKNSRAP